MLQKRISTDDVRLRLGQILDQVRFYGKDFIVTRYGHPVAKLVPIAPEQSVVSDHTPETETDKL